MFYTVWYVLRYVQFVSRWIWYVGHFILFQRWQYSLAKSTKGRGSSDGLGVWGSQLRIYRHIQNLSDSKIWTTHYKISHIMCISIEYMNISLSLQNWLYFIMCDNSMTIKPQLLKWYQIVIYTLFIWRILNIEHLTFIFRNP